MKGSNNYGFLCKLLEAIKQTVDGQDPDTPEASKVCVCVYIATRVSYRVFCLGGRGKYAHRPKVLGSLVHLPAQGAGFPSTPASPRCWVP